MNPLRLRLPVAGLDSAGLNMGNNLFLSYHDHPRDNDYFIGTGVLAKRTQVSFSAAYELLQNLFVDVNVSNRYYDIPTLSRRNEFFFTIGIRWNIGRRDFEF